MKDKKIEGFSIDIAIKTTTLDGHEVLRPVVFSQKFMKRPYFRDKFVKYHWFQYFLDDAFNRIRDEYLREFVKEEILEKYGEEKWTLKSGRTKTVHSGKCRK